MAKKKDDGAPSLEERREAWLRKMGELNGLLYPEEGDTPAEGDAAEGNEAP